MCIFVIFQIAGIAVATLAGGLYWVRTLAIAIGLAFASCFLLFKKKNFIYISIAFIIGIITMSGVLDIYNIRDITANKAEIYGTISSEIVEGKNTYYFTITDVSVNGKRVKGDATVFVKNLPIERAGQNIKIKGDIKTSDFNVASGYFLANYRNGIYHTVNADSVQNAGNGSLPFSTRYRLGLKKKLYQNTSGVTAEICSALLFGDKFGISDTLYNDIQSSGLAHIFAVSGLHIGMLAGVLIWILTKFKFKKRTQFITVMSVLILYGTLCGFPASVIRAIVMTGVYLLADCTGDKRDNLSCLSFAAILVLLINPADLFTAGFLMSFTAVAGIFILEKPIENKLKFLPDKINQIVSVSIAVNIMIYPILAQMFGKFQTLFLVSNILILPILPFIYSFMLIICSLVQIIPFFTPILKVLDIIVFPVKMVSMSIGSMAISVINVKALGLFSILYYFLLLLFSRFIFLTKKEKVKTGCYFTAIFTIAIVAVTVL